MKLDPRALSLEQGMEYHRQGQTSHAERIYRDLLARDPSNVDANYLLGLIELDRGRFATASLLIGKARDLAPNNPLYHYNMGRAEQGQGKLAQAEQSFRKALHHKSDYIEARYALAFLMQSSGRLDECIVEYKKLLRSSPQIAAACNNLANALSASGRKQEALKYAERAVELDPNYGQGWGNLGNLLTSLGRTEDAGRAFDKAIEVTPKDAVQLYNYGNLKQFICDYEGAIELYRRATELQPDLAGAYNNLGNVYKLLGRLKLATEAFETAIRLRPEDPDPPNNLANAQVSAGDIDAALVNYRRAVELRPDYVSGYSNLVYALNYPSGVDEQEILAEHREWSRRYEWPVEVEKAPDPQPRGDRRLRIGYVSGDFRRHSVAFFFEPLLQAQDRSRYQIFCYANLRFQDDVTERIRAACDQWRPINGLDDNQAAQLIRQDRIDLLVDLSGHTDGNRLLVFARRPAPVQINWLGYPNTTGTNAMGYRLVDAVTDPPGVADELASEELVRLPRGFLCYQGYELSPPVLPPPLLRAGHVTFGSFNNLTKVNRAVVECWARLLHAVPDSRLMMKTNQLEDADMRERYHGWFEQLGIARERIDLRARTAGLAEHLNVYGEVDIALDTFPYNGTTTTCEALWMGVPVVALAGNSHRSRVSMSILTHAGMPELVAADEDQLIERVRALVADPQALRERRVRQRRAMQQSALCDLQGFARAMEKTFDELFARLDFPVDSAS